MVNKCGSFRNRGIKLEPVPAGKVRKSNNLDKPATEFALLLAEVEPSPQIIPYAGRDAASRTARLAASVEVVAS